MESAIEIVCKCTKKGAKMPEPTYKADILSREFLDQNYHKY